MKIAQVLSSNIKGKIKLTKWQQAALIEQNSKLVIFKRKRGISIHISGKASAIPNLKNGKSMFSHRQTTEFMARVTALDGLWRASPGTSKLKRVPKTQKVHVLLVNAKRPGNYDPIGCLETIQDWLEPSSKAVGTRKVKSSRNWGIGLIEDDSQIVGLSLRHDEHHQEKLSPEQTHIFIQSYWDVESAQNKFIEELI